MMHAVPKRSFSLQGWALHGSEILLSVQTIAAAMVIIFHRHRFIVLRRVLVLVGLLYMYRAVTMWVTAMPKADPNYECAPKFGAALTFGEIMKRVIKICTGKTRKTDLWIPL
jgi:shingomyelin synthase